MKFPQMMTTVLLIGVGALMSQFSNQVEPQAAAAMSATSPSTKMNFDALDSDNCVCGPDCQCHDACKSRLAELQQKYDATLASRSDEKQSGFRTSMVGPASGGSSGGKVVASAAPSSNATIYSTVTATNSNGSSGGGRSVTRSTPVRTVVAGAANVVTGTDQTAARVVTAPVRNYQARWTHPGTIQQHMQKDHGVQVVGVSQSDLLAHHDAIHDAIGPVYSTRSTQTRTYSSSPSQCPGGICPTSGSANVRVGLFGRMLRR